MITRRIVCYTNSYSAMTAVVTSLLWCANCMKRPALRLRRRTRGASGDLLSQRLRTIRKRVLMEVSLSQLEISRARSLTTKVLRSIWLQLQAVSLLRICRLDHKVWTLTAPFIMYQAPLHPSEIIRPAIYNPKIKVLIKVHCQRLSVTKMSTVSQILSTQISECQSLTKILSWHMSR